MKSGTKTYYPLSLILHPSPGFTLIELLVVVGILGILTAVAIPNFVSYRKRAFDAAIKSDIRQAVIAEQAYELKHGEYANSVVELKDSGFRQSEGISLEITVQGDHFDIRGTHQKCAKGTGEYFFSNMTGIIEEQRSCE
jgi:type IV pilus assembly protein PilA